MEKQYYVRVEWPECQEYMEEEWFEDEAVLDNSEDAGPSTYFIPVKYTKISNLYTEEEVRSLLINFSELHSIAMKDLIHKFIK